jgi:ABC-type lipoprotein export system ATPase subunit
MPNTDNFIRLKKICKTYTTGINSYDALKDVNLKIWFQVLILVECSSGF